MAARKSIFAQGVGSTRQGKWRDNCDTDTYRQAAGKVGASFGALGSIRFAWDASDTTTEKSKLLRQ